MKSLVIVALFILAGDNIYLHLSQRKLETKKPDVAIMYKEPIMNDYYALALEQKIQATKYELDELKDRLGKTKYVDRLSNLETQINALGKDIENESIRDCKN